MMEELRRLRLEKAELEKEISFLLLPQSLYNIAGSSSQSMSRAGCPYDNAPMERYYNTLKTELIYQYRFETVAELDYAVSAFAYDWYNQVLPHMYNGYLAPFEKRAECTIKQWCYKKR